ncbi:TonB-dependent receptor [Colwellia sp. MEBiC06753]
MKTSFKYYNNPLSSAIKLALTRPYIVSAAILSGTLLPTIVAAQDTEKKEFEVISVTAQKRSQSINEVPMAISAFNANDLKELGIEDTSDLANAVPGFNFSDTAFGPPVYTLRGVGFNESSAQATSTVGVYVDEISIPFPIMTKGLNVDIERVEVLKGPQGTLYGRNSTAGAVNYIAGKPLDFFESSVTVSLASYDTISTEAFVTGELTDGIKGRFAVKKVDSGEGWQESISRDETLGREDKLAMRGSLSFDLSSATEALLSVMYVQDKSETLAPQNFDYVPGAAGGLPFASSVFGSQLNTEGNPEHFTSLLNDPQAADWTEGRTPAVDQSSVAVSLKIEHDLSSTMTLTSLTGFSSFEDNGSEYERTGFKGVTVGEIKNNPLQPVLLATTSALTGGALSIGYEGFLRGKYANAPDSEYVTADYVYQNGEIDAFSQEIRITEVLDDLVWIAGVYYSDSEVDYQTQQDFGLASNVNILPLPGYGFNMVENDINQKTSTVAAFVNIDWLLSDELTVTTALRYSEDKAEYAGCTRDVDGGAAALMNAFFYGGKNNSLVAGDGYNSGGCVTVTNFATADQMSGVVEDTLKEDSLSWRLAANYEIDNNVSVYASYSRGFKAGSFPSLAALTDTQLIPVVQEQLDAYEIGFKSTLAENTLRFNGAAFYYDYKDKQLLTKKIIPVFGTSFTLSNVDESKVSGLEFDAQWLATDGLTIAAAVGWLDTEITEGIGFNQPGQYIDLAGSPLPFAAEFQANLTAKYEWELDSGLIIFAASDLSYSSESHADFESNKSQTIAVSDFEGAPYEVVIDSQPYSFDKRFVNPSYKIINARFGVESDYWQVYAWARNLTDEFYTTTAVKNNEMYAKYPGKGATYGVTFQYNWY